MPLVRLVSLASAGVALLGCAGLFEPETVVAADGTAALVVPWTFSPIELNDAAVIESGNRVAELYVVVLRDDRRDLASDRWVFAEQSRQRQLDSMQGARVLEGPTDRTVGGRPAVQAVLSGAVDGTSVTVLHTAIEGEWSMFQVLAWTLERDWSRQEGQLRAVVDSFVEHEPPKVVPAPLAATRTFLSADEQVTVQLPASWENAPDLNDTAGIEARHPDDPVFVIVISEPAEDVTLSLEDYGRLTRGALLGSWEEPQEETPETVDLDGRPAVRAVLHGTHAGARMVGVHTVVRDRVFLHQVHAWTTPSLWEANRAELERIAGSLRVAPAPH